MPDVTVVQRALLSVYDKEGIVPFAQFLHQQGVELIASGGTAQHLAQAGIPVTPIEQYAASPPLLDGRVKTLHPKVHAGLLADRHKAEHRADLAQLGYPLIDLLICNLYPFQQTVSAGQSDAEIIEMIDIGGPALIRAAAKNFAGGCAVVVHPADYAAVTTALQSGGLPRSLRAQLAARAFGFIAAYDGQIAQWFASRTLRQAEAVAQQADDQITFPTQIGPYVRASKLRYGENPHQAGFLYQEQTPRGVAWGTLLCGKALSYTNLLDLDAAYRAAYDVTQLAKQPACAIIKHAVLCGLAAAPSQSAAFLRALSADPQSAFGSVLGFSHALSAEAAEAIVASKLFVECIVAPGFSDQARATLSDRINLRLLQVPIDPPEPTQQLHRIGGGLLVQGPDEGLSTPQSWRVVSQRAIPSDWICELQFAELCAKLLRSNAISITKQLTLIGAGSGQVSRIDAAQHAIGKAAERSQDSFLGSDAFFPFADCVEAAAAAGVCAIIQPGGSIRDADTITACDRHNIALVFTGRRHFRH